ncbi:MAG TPA: HAMP domain-containing sensor histidine kinase [Candidatus Saccharimonadales bacterium]|nr:HAMP domain-containing sensor histidine kinase [Candidatus Saccharimonadales bacterium]
MNVQQPISPLIAAAHELKTPLLLINGLSTHLLNHGKLNPDQREMLERILLSSGYSLRLAESLVDSYQVAQAQFEFPLEPVNVSQVVEEVVHELTPYSKKIDREIITSLRQRNDMVVAHKTFFGEVVYSLLDNALRHGKGKGKIVITNRQHREFSRLTIRNEGAVLSQRDLSQLERNLGTYLEAAPSLGGTSGIGLYIARQLVGAMSGKLGLERKPSHTGVYVDLLSSQQLSFLSP